MFQRHGETKIAIRVLVTAVHFCIVGKPHELLEGPVHLFRGSLEETTAAGSEQGVAAKKIIAEEISDMSRGLARNEKDASALLANGDLISLLNAARESRNPSLIALVTVDLE